ncbi:MAG: beta-lactamase family protein [Clostridia bacterium]|nr:beta-lactamase family protein [Clostridia bacterium]
MLNAIQYFTRESHIMACLSVTCGDAATEHHAMDGFIRAGDVCPVSEDSLFDLASLTKLFTGLTVMRLHEEGLLALDAPAAQYAPQYTGLKGATVDQLLGFEVQLTTPQRVDAQPDRAAGLAQLRAAQAAPQGTNRFYSDMHAMVLGEVIEGAAGMPLYEAFRRYILDPLGMAETFACVPPERRADCVSCDREHRIEGERWILREGVAPGVPHDPKARLLSPDGAHLCGHAGLFSTRRDMVKLCQGVLSGKVISSAGLAAMARNRMGRPLPEGGHTQYLGSQCYVKHPNQYFSEIPVYMSDRAIGLSGFTGHHISIDPETGVFALMLGNRVMDRLSVLIPEKGRSLTDYGLAADGSGQVTWPDGRQVYSSVDWVHQKDARLHRPIAARLSLPPWRKAGSEWP